RLERATRLFEAAKTANKAGDAEAAVLRLFDAQRVLFDAGKEADSLTARIEAFAKRIAAAHARRRKSIDRAASLLAKVADRYIAAGWLRIAEPLVRESERLSPSVAAPTIAAFRKAELGSEATDDAAIGEMFRPGEFIWGKDEWVFDGPVLSSPSYDKGRQLRIGGRRLDFAGKERSVTVEWRADGERDVRLVFAYRHIEEYCELRIQTWNSGPATVEIRRVRDDQLEKLAESSVPLSDDERSGWLRLRIDLGGEQLRAIVGEHQPIRAKSPELPRGFLGLMVVGDAPENSPVEFRGLKLEGFE
ncbi:MAG: hypothetical protein KDB80_12350, partial [Planctomycetes bacterium]|nr:hypothetical protein [Planctomycetota bacterium]